MHDQIRVMRLVEQFTGVGLVDGERLFWDDMAARRR
jgi:hypothetical protein